MTKVFCTVPNTGRIDRFVALKLLELQSDERCEVRFCLPEASPSENCRSIALREFLAGDDEFWLSIDADNPPAENPLDLVELGSDLVGLPTPVWQSGESTGGAPRLCWNAYKRREGGYVPVRFNTARFKKEGPLEAVDAIGTGCFLAHRRIFSGPVLEQPFQRRWRRDGVVELGSDLAFSERVKAAGFEIHVHWGYLCNHFSTVNLAEVMAAVSRAREGRERCETS